MSTDEMTLSNNEKNKEKLLRFINKHQTKEKTNNKIEKAEVSDDYPLSFAQQRLWFLEQLDGPSDVYNIPCVLKLKGKININMLEQSISYIINRHDVLKTSFFEKNGIPRQKINSVKFSLDIKNVGVNEAIDNIIHEEIKKTFDLEKAPLMRVKLITTDTNNSYLILTIHHIIADSWSLNVLVNELAHCYQSYCENKIINLKPLSIQYHDYCVWQRKRLETDIVSEQINYWREKLDALPSLLKLPSYHARPVKQSYRGGFFHFTINKILSNTAIKFANKQDVSLYMLLLSIFKILLYRYSGQTDLVIGTPAANRVKSQLDDLIGFFINTIVIRNQINLSTSFESFLQDIKVTTVSAFDNQEIPFDYIVETLKPERSLSYSPLFQVEFGLQNTLPNELKLAGIETEILFVDSQTTKFDLTLSFMQKEDTLCGLIEYNSDIFDEAFISRIPKHYEQLLTHAIHASSTPICYLNMLTKSERELLLETWGRSNIDKPIVKNFLELFEEQVNKTPLQLAVISHNENKTYQELNNQSNQLAHALIEQGIRPGQRIALYMERGISYITAMLAIMKISCAFVPFNPDANQNRNEEMLINVMPACILSHEIYRNSIESLSIDAPSCYIDKLNVESFPTAKPEINIDLNDIAYIIYTSGSTGSPKGAMVEHKGMINHLLAKIETLQLTQHDIVAQIAVQTFDVSVWQCLVALLVGATTHIITGEEAWEPNKLLNAVEQYSISILETVPSHLDILLNEIEKVPCRYTLNTLRYMISNGEAMSTKQCERWFKAFPKILLIDAYGPTECSDDVTHLVLSQNSSIDMAYLPAGQLIHNARIYVLDDYLNPTPIGVVGELYIGGLCVGTGYFNDETRTKQSFIVDPFSHEVGARMYKTGDLAKYHEDGTLEFLGRKDFQLKIRGFRIEPGEIEAIMQTHVAVEKCVVMPVTDNKNNTQLVAYVVIPTRPSPSASMLRNFCKNYLPDYMVPTYIIILDEFPLLKNGKIDRSRLPPVSASEMRVNTQTYVAPDDQLSQDLTKMWAKAIGLERVGMTDNFFHMGGHSLLAVELVSQMKELLGEKISLQLLFEYPTIQEIITETKSMQ